MISRFVNLFKKSDLDEQRAFQHRVVKILMEVYPEKEFSLNDDPLALDHKGQTLGLTNIKAHFLLSTRTDQDLRAIVSEHFANVFDVAGLEDMATTTWEVANAQLMPQLMPSEYLEKLDLVSRSFGGGIVLGFVLDSEKTYSYVTKENAARWGVGDDIVYETALQNLSDRSHGIEATGVPGPNGLVVVNSMDGFDATRISLVEMRDYFATIIGFPFYFGVPNRDFLICWTKNEDPDFQNSMKIQVASDYEERPYPLSPIIFEAEESGKINEVLTGSIDRRAENAPNN